MQVKGLKVVVIIVTVAVTLALLFGIQFVNERLNIEKPLFKLYSDTKLVLKPSIAKEGDTTEIKLTVKKTDNLFTAYQDIKTKTDKIMGDSKYQIKLIDKRSPALDDIYSNCQFVIYEALAKGNFTTIPDKIDTIAAKAGATTKVYIDQDNIYISLYKGDGYLYEIIPRKNYQLPGTVADTNGSDQIDKGN